MAKPYLMIHIHIGDFSKWKAVYDGHIEARKQAGMKELHVLRNMENPNEITVLFELEDLEKAKAFLDSDDLREKIKESGVVGEPKFEFLT